MIQQTNLFFKSTEPHITTNQLLFYPTSTLNKTYCETNFNHSGVCIQCCVELEAKLRNWSRTIFNSMDGTFQTIKAIRYTIRPAERLNNNKKVTNYLLLP